MEKKAGSGTIPTLYNHVMKGISLRHDWLVDKRKWFAVLVLLLLVPIVYARPDSGNGNVDREAGGKPYVGYWRFDEGTGYTIAHDSSGYYNDGTVHGATWVDGKYGKALSFDGLDDYVIIPDSDSLDITGDLTIAAWVKTSSTFGERIIFSNQREYHKDGYSLRMTTDGNVEFNSQGFDLISIGKINAGTWKHVAVTLVGTTADIYIDGEFDNSGTVYLAPLSNSVDQSIGATYVPYYFFQGIIDEVKVYDYSFGFGWLSMDTTLRENMIRTLLQPAGDFVAPNDKFGLSAPYIGSASIFLVATVATAICVKRVRPRKENQ